MDLLVEAQIAQGGVLEVRNGRKGRSLFTARLVKGGEIVLSEAPILLLVAPEMAQSTCLACLRAVSPLESIPCSGCRQACFCTPACQQMAQGTPWLHSAPICSAYARLAALGLPPEDQAQLRFLLHALALRHSGTPEAERRFRALSDLVGEATEAERAVASRLSPALGEVLRGVEGASCLIWTVDELAAVLRKEQLNSYGILASPQQAAAVVRAEVERQGGAGARAEGPSDTSGAGPSCSAAAETSGAGSSSGRPIAAAGDADADQPDDGERRLRGCALYWQASLINHECLPNVARYDFFDSRRPDSTHVTFRALHDLPPGTELAQSYVPLHWSLAERQAQCRDVYGFACTCARCQTESQWSDVDEDEESEWETDSGDGDMGLEVEAADEEGAAAGAGDAAASGEEVEMQDAKAPIRAPPGEEGPHEPAYLRLFLLKYMCARPGCFGTAAPAKPGSAMLECNVCGQSRSEKQFLRELEEAAQKQQRQQRQQPGRQQPQQGRQGRATSR